MTRVRFYVSFKPKFLPNLLICLTLCRFNECKD